MLFLLRNYAKSENYKATITERDADRRCGDDLNEGNFFADSIGGIIVIWSLFCSPLLFHPDLWIFQGSYPSLDRRAHV